jgi:hypothetical protein
MRYLVLNTILIIFMLISGSDIAEAQGTRVDFSTIPKSGTILIYAHQDDDLIWMLPFWNKTEKFICGAMPSAPSFRSIISRQQTFLNNNGYNIAYESNWQTPWDDVSDVEYTQYYIEGNTSYNYLLNDHLETRLYNNPNELSRYEINKLKAKLEQYFADPSMKRVITHNNWGEYGHRHHMGVNKAVRELAVKYRKDVWMLGCNNGDFRDIDVPGNIIYSMGSFNTPGLFTGIRSIYQAPYDRWTWSDVTLPSGDHKFIKIVDGGNDRSNTLKGDEITYPGPTQQASGAYIFDGDDDYLTLKGNNNSSFTIAIRIRPDQIREMDISAMAEYPQSSKNDRNLYMTGDGHIRARIYDGSTRTVTSTAVISGGSWTHITITGNGSSLKLYINGTLDKSITSGTAITNYSTPEMVIGLATITGSCFKGQMNDVRMYNRILSDSEIAQLSGKGYTINSSAGSGGTITPSGDLTVSAGSDISFSISPGSGYQISDVTVDNSSVGAVSSYKFTYVSDNHKISASFRRISYSITAEAGTGGTISPEGTITANNGSKQTFTIKPENGYKISDVRVDKVSVGPVSEYTFSNINSSHSISATFVPIVYIIKSSTGKGGLIDPAGTINLGYGSSKSFTITPENGFMIADVLIDNVSAGAVTTYTFSNINSDHTIFAMFQPITFTVAGISGSGGTLSPSGQVKVNSGKDQHFSIMPDYGYKVSGIMLDYLPVALSTSDFSLYNVTRNHILSVSFTKIRTFTITAGSGKNGSISPLGDTLVTEGSELHYVITPSPGYRVSSLFIDTVPIGPVTEFTFNNISGNHSISATFSAAVKADVFPNPFRDEFSIIIRSPYDYLYKISLVTMSNRTVFVYTDLPVNTTINLKPEIPPGLYILNVYHKGKKIASSRVVKY